MNAHPQRAVYTEEPLWFERLIAELSTRFINLASDRVDSEIEAAQKLICETLGFDRSTLLQWDEDAKTLFVTHSWATAGYPTTHEYQSADVPWYSSKILRGETVCFARLSELSEEAVKDKEAAKGWGTKSNLTMPLSAGGPPFGALSFGMLRAEREWPEPLVGRLRTIADVFANALARKRSDEALLQSRERMRLAVESASLGLWTWNVRHDEMWASDTTYALLGWPQDVKLTQEGFLKVVHPEDRARVQDTIERATQLPMEFCLDHRIVRPGGSVRWVGFRGCSHTGLDGKLTHMSGIILDMTERKVAAERFRLAVEASPTAMVMADGEGKIVLANSRIAEMFGYKREELAGQSSETLFSKRSRQGYAARSARVDTHPSASPTDTAIGLYALRKDGSEFPVEIGQNPIEADEGRLTLTAIVDITERIQAAEAVRNSEKLFRTVANTLPVLIWMSGTDKMCTFCNQGWLTFTGRTADEEAGEGWISGVHPDELKRCLEIYSAAFDARSEFEMEYRLRRFDGEYRWVVDRGAPYFEADGAFRGYIRSCIDITDRKLSEQNLVTLTERLIEANQQVERMKERLETENVYLRKEITVEHYHHEVIGQSEAIRRVLMSAEQVAITDSAVLLLGETGTGKELIARAIHQNSRRRDRLMVKVNCAALPATLVESELFGREKGAFTGALAREIGRFELANGSTILLDEIGELPLELQAKLLRVLQEGEFERLGSSKTIRVDARLIAATSRDLGAAVKEGRFREDLYYRLNVFPIRVPPLRERREDIPMLTWHFLQDLGGRMGREVESVRATTMKEFQGYDWPGNVRELRNVIERHLIINRGPVFEAALPKEAGASAQLRRTAEEVERSHIRQVLGNTDWRIRGQGGAAEILGLKPTTLESRMKRLGIVRQ